MPPSPAGLTTALLVISILVGAPVAPQDAPQAADRRETFPTFGVSVVPPEGWAALPVGETGHVGRWGKPHPKLGTWVAAVAAEAEPLADPPQDFAADIAKRMGATVSDKKTTLDGVEAVYVTGATKAMAGRLRAEDAVVAVRGQYGYVVSGLGSPGNVAADAVEAVRASWKWVEMEPPVRHLDALAEPVIVLEQFQMQVPAIMRRFPVTDERVETHLGVFNAMNAVQEMSVGARIVPISGGVEEVRSLVGRTSFKMFNLARPPTWAPVPGKPRRWVSSDFEYTEKAKGLEARLIGRHAVVELNPGEAAVMNFMIQPESDEDRRAYEAALVAMVNSIQVPSAAARRAAQVKQLGRTPWSYKPRADEGRGGKK